MKARWLACVVIVAACDQAGTEAPDASAVDSSQDVAEVAAADTVESARDTSAPADATEPPDGTAPSEDTAPAADLAPADSGAANDTASLSDAAGVEGVRHTFAIEPITVPSGTERQVCRTINIPAGEPLDIVRFESRMRGISHHFNLYKVIDGSAFDPVSAEESATHDCAPAAEQLRGDAAYIYGSATPDRVMQTPPGVAFHLAPGQRLILEYHAINYTLDPIEAWVEIDLISAAPGTEILHHAEIMWFANWGFALPPHKETSDTTRCSVPYAVEVFGLMSHFHELGTNFVVEAIQAGETSVVYEDDDWAHPKYQPFDPPLSLAAGDALRWTCTWNNTRDSWTMPNKGSKDEMCMVFAAAYPRDALSADPIQCNKF